MLRVLLKVLFAAAALAAVWAFVPIAGRTMAERWHRARTPAELFDRTWAELRGAPARPAAHAQARSSAPARPTESHRDEDRKALDRIVSEHLQD